VGVREQKMLNTAALDNCECYALHVAILLCFIDMTSTFSSIAMFTITGFEILPAVVGINIQIFWRMTPCQEV
jgi:hypothetical protein